MTAVLERAAGAPGVRLAEEAFNLGAFALYAVLGFEAREPLVVLVGRPWCARPAGWDVRPLREKGPAASAALHDRVHGHSRANELRESVGRGLAWVAGWSDGGVRSGGHSLARQPRRGRDRGGQGALLAGAARSVEAPLALLSRGAYRELQGA